MQALRNLLLTVVLVSAAIAAEQHAMPAFRWAKGAPGCTAETASDGNSYYHLSAADYELTVGVDPQELEKIPRRTEHAFSVFVSYKNKTSARLEVLQNRYTLEYVNHFNLVQSSSDPRAILSHLQQITENLNDEVERQVKKHPELKEQKEAELQPKLKDYTEMIDFISTRALRPTVLEAGNTSASGWVFFAVKSRWIGEWKRPEQFILRMPVNDRMIEFPFSLPPEGGKVELRHRPAQ